MEKLLSVVMFGRNDSYMGNYRYRLETCLNNLGLLVDSLDCQEQIEVIFVDWGSAVPLSQEIELCETAAAITRFEIVEPRVAKTLLSSSNIHSSMAVNMGVRRARGEYIMFADSDSIFTKYGFEALLNILKGDINIGFDPHKAIFNIRRYQLPWELVQRLPTIKTWQKIIPYIAPMLRTEMSGAKALGGFAAAQLMSRELWIEARGYDENLVEGWGASDNDLTLRVNQKYRWADAYMYGVMAFHMEHNGIEEMTIGPKRKSNKVIIHDDIAVNSDAWGRPDLELEQAYAEPVAARRMPDMRVFADDPYKPLWGIIDSSQAAIDTLSGSHRAKHFNAHTAGIFDAAFVTKDKSGNHLPHRADLINLLNTFASAEFPVNAYLFGNVTRGTPEMLCRNNPAINLYISGLFPANDPDHSDAAFTELSIVLESSAYRGYAQFVDGDAKTAVARITEQHGQNDIELAVINVRDNLNDLPQILGAVLSSSSQQAMIVFFDEELKLGALSEGVETIYNATKKLFTLLGQPNIESVTWPKINNANQVVMVKVGVMASGGVAFWRVHFPN